MKRCCKCNIEKSYQEFNKNKNSKDGLLSYCKLCNRTYMKEYYGKAKLTYWIVYLLPSSNYVGYTNNIKWRIRNHKSKYKRTADNYVIISKVQTQDQARQMEAWYHNRGYRGKHCNRNRSLDSI